MQEGVGPGFWGGHLGKIFGQGVQKVAGVKAAVIIAIQVNQKGWIRGHVQEGIEEEFLVLKGSHSTDKKESKEKLIEYVTEGDQIGNHDNDKPKVVLKFPQNNGQEVFQVRPQVIPHQVEQRGDHPQSL